MKLKRKQDFSILSHVCVFRAYQKNKMATQPLIGWDIFYFSSETAEQNSRKLDRKQDLNVCVFGSPQPLKTFLCARLRDILWYGTGVCPSVCLSVRLSTKLVNTIQTEPFKLGPSNLVHLLLTSRGRTLKGQGHMLHINVKLCKHDTELTV